MMNSSMSTMQAAQMIWDYLRLGETADSADCLLVLGSRDDRVASYAAKLAKRFSYRAIIITGGPAPHNESLRTWREASEAEHFAAIMQAAGVTQPLILEKSALNTGDNFRQAYTLLARFEMKLRSLVVVTKPYMERRARATFEAQWPGESKPSITMASPSMSFDEYCNDTQPYETVVNIMVGDLQRILLYPARGLQAEQHVPATVLAALDILVDAGYTEHLLSGTVHRKF